MTRSYNLDYTPRELRELTTCRSGSLMRQRTKHTTVRARSLLYKNPGVMKAGDTFRYAVPILARKRELCHLGKCDRFSKAVCQLGSRGYVVQLLTLWP